MKFQKKYMLLFACVLILGMTACGEGGEAELTKPAASTQINKETFERADVTPTPIQPTEVQAAETNNVGKEVSETDSQQFSNDAGTSIDVLREEIGQTPALFGMAYIGYFDSATADVSEIDFDQWFYGEASPLTEQYPFVSEIDKQHTIGAEGHLYCVIARDYDSSITVTSIDGNEELYRSANGDPILLFCSMDGDAQKADTTVSVTTADGSVYQWQPALDQLGFPELLVAEDRELLSWDFTPIPDDGFDLEGWLVEGWLGPTAAGLAFDSNGTTWWIYTWDGSVSYCVSFYANEGNGYNGDAVVECFYTGDSDVQAQWQGWWRIDTESDPTSRLYLDLMLVDGKDRLSFEYASVVTESYQALISQSGEYLLLVADDGTPLLPIFPEGIEAVELTLGAG